jgi:hypothetical protein
VGFQLPSLIHRCVPFRIAYTKIAKTSTPTDAGALQVGYFSMVNGVSFRGTPSRVVREWQREPVLSEAEGWTTAPPTIGLS